MSRFNRVWAAGIFVGAVAGSSIAEAAQSAETVVRLYEGAAPGSESWTHTEKESRTNLWLDRFTDWLELQGLLKK